MKEEDNVYEDTTRAEETTAVSNGGEDRDDAAQQDSTVLGKFKDVNALVRAYGSLQAEFTRRSQRLKELEKMTENFAKGELSDARSGAEKLRKKAKERKAETKQFDEFMVKTMKVNAQETRENVPLQNPEIFEDKPLIEDLSSVGIEEQDGTRYEVNTLAKQTGTARKGIENTAMREGEEEKSIAQSASTAYSADTLYEQVSRDETVRLKIIGEYLASLGKSGAPLMAGGVGLLATPPKKPKSISDAGNMALLYFKKPQA